MTLVYDDGMNRFPVEILRGTPHYPRAIQVSGLIATLERAEPTRDGGYLFTFWLDVGLGFKLWSKHLHALDEQGGDFTFLGKSNGN